jgi:integrase
MAKRVGTWAGGYIRQTKDGKKRIYIIERWHHGDRIHVSTGCTTLEAARKEFARYELDPLRYQPGGGAGAGALFLDTKLVLAYQEHQLEKGLTEEWTDEVGRRLSKWADVLRGRDLRALSLHQDLLPALERLTHKPHSIKALKGLFRWLRETGRIERTHDATLDLRVPQSRSNRPLGERAYPMELAERFYAGLSSWDYVPGLKRGAPPTEKAKAVTVSLQPIRDIFVLRAKCGMHTSEIGRLAEGSGLVRELEGYGEIAGTLAFPHKRGDWHVVSVDAQTLAAAKRLRALGRVPTKVYLSRAMRRAGAEIGLPDFKLENLRHSFITWAAEHGTEIRPKDVGVPLALVSQVAGHRSMAMTTQRYVGLFVPPLMKLPLRLEHPEDPPLPA